ncbi:MAG: hypothetical protein QGI09_03810, partial [Dehalococcoidia bacterium]|nr:hypothetical protein [Dehalococcoidia bacterium]
RYRFQSLNPLKDFTKQGSRYQNLRQLKRHIASMSNNLGSDLRHFLPIRTASRAVGKNPPQALAVVRRWGTVGGKGPQNKPAHDTDRPINRLKVYS